MKNRLTAVAALALTLAVAATTTAGAVERTTHSHLRVEAIDRTLDPGTNYSNGGIRTRNSNACGPRNSRREWVRGANAMGIVGHAASVNRRLAPFRTSDTFDFGLIVCQIGDYKGFEDQAWLYKVNHVSPSVGADRFRVGRGDDVLWYFANFSTGRNTGDELALREVPVRVRPGQPFEVRAVAYSSEGAASPAAGVQVTRAVSPTAGDGTTTVIARTTPGTMRIRGTRGNDIPTAPVEVCVRVNLSECPARRGETFVGTNRADDIRATGGPDSIRPRREGDLVSARAGDDVVAARRGGRDRVNCGPGRDVVRADRDDRLADNCEVVKR